ncbi:MAG: GtrA family protein [Rhodanobacter sp.]
MSTTALSRLRTLVERSRFLRFLVSGGLNTAVTYIIYVALLQILEYRLAYTVAYVVGILLSYSLNRAFVFRSHRGWSSVLLFPFVYLAQYLVSLAIIWIWVGKLGLPKLLAPPVAVLISIPLTYLFSGFVFTPKPSQFK